MIRAPGVRSLQILLLAAIRVVDAAVQQQLAGAAFDGSERHLGKERHGVLIELGPTHGIEVVEQTNAVVIPAPPEIAGQRPQTLLRRRDETVERARLADNRGDLRSGFA